MPRMPGAEWLGEHSPRAPMSRYDVVCIHTIVGNAPAHAAHFSTWPDGKIGQSRDTRWRSAANLDGNHRVIAIENADGAKDVPLTAAQVEACAQVLAWAHKTHGVPLQLCPDSKPGSRGLAYHRQGIDGNFGSFRFPGRVSGGERWSQHFGKVCPRDVRIAQLPAILARAKEIVRPKQTLTLATANLNFGRPAENQQRTVDSIDADVLFTQEDVRQPAQGRERVILRKSAREVVKLRGAGRVAAAKSRMGFKIRKRQLPFKDVVFPHGEEVRLVGMHDAPRRFSPLRPIYHARFRKLVWRRKFIGGGDWNERLHLDPADLAKRRRAKWFGARIDGFVVSPGLLKYVKRTRRSEPRRDGHPTVYLDMEF